MNKIRFIDKNDFCVAARSDNEQWGYKSINISAAHKKATGKNIHIAVLDTGLPEHSHIQAYIECACSFTDDGLFDRMGHATHICGIIKDIAPAARIHIIKVLDNDGMGCFEWIAKGLEKARQMNVDIVNMSFGTQGKPPQEIEEKCKELNEKNILVVASAGNDHAKKLNYPAAYDSVISVGALTESGEKATWANQAEADVYAPSEAYTCMLNSGYGSMRGTSQSAAYISGILGLILDYHRTHKCNSLCCSKADAIEHIHNMQSHDPNYLMPSFCTNCDELGG